VQESTLKLLLTVLVFKFQSSAIVRQLLAFVLHKKRTGFFSEKLNSKNLDKNRSKNIFIMNHQNNYVEA